MAWPTRGDRFDLDLGAEHQVHHATTLPSLGFITDVKERSPAAPKAPSAPSLKNQTTGFPAHRKRPNRFASNKQQTPKLPEDVPTANHHGYSADAKGARTQEAQSDTLSFEEREKRDIDEENKQKLAQMSNAEIEEARAELLSSLNPALVEKLLRKANIDDDRDDGDFPNLNAPPPESAKKDSTKSSKKVSFQDDISDESLNKPHVSLQQLEANDLESNDQTSESVHAHLSSSTPSSNNHDEIQSMLDSPSIHFPHAPKPPDPDPLSSSFFSDLHSKYFPELAHDPSKLSWMTEASDISDSNPASNTNYSPDVSGFAPAEIRFSFAGALLSPRVAQSIPVTKGLHHHGDAPDAAGYTIGELAILARSTYPSQRCIAYSVLGKILFRLGKGEFGDTMAEDFDEDENNEQAEDVHDDKEKIERRKGELARGLWQVIHDEHIIDILTTAVSDNGENRHLSAKVYAQEAVWLWQKGGGRRWKAA